MVTHRPGIGTTRAGEIGGHGTAHGGGLAEGGRFEGQHLLVVGQHPLQLGQRGAGAHGGHQFGGLVIEHPAMVGDLQGLAHRLATVEGLAVTADDVERPAGGKGLGHLRLQRLADVLLDHG